MTAPVMARSGVTAALLGLVAAAIAPIETPEPTPVVPAAGTFEIPPVTNTEVEKYLALAENRLVRLGDDVWDKCRTELITGAQQGLGVPDIRDRITAQAGIAAPRAGVIARTEINRAANAGAQAQMNQIDSVALVKTWITWIDNATRTDHADADGQQVAMSDPFIIGGENLSYPGDGDASPENVINCRCTLSYDLPDDQLVSSVSPCADDEEAFLDEGAGDMSSVVGCGDVAASAVTADVQATAQQQAEKWASRSPHGKAQQSWNLYQLQGYYEKINGYLRGTSTSAEDAQLAKGMLAAFDKAGMDAPHGLTLFRGLLGKPGLDWGQKLQVGKTYVEDGVVSTTAKQGAASGWLTDFANYSTVPAGSAVLKLKVPKGYRILGGATNTFETMLPPGTTYRVLSKALKIKYDSAGTPQGSFVEFVVEVTHRVDLVDSTVNAPGPNAHTASAAWRIRMINRIWDGQLREVPDEDVRVASSFGRSHVVLYSEDQPRDYHGRWGDSGGPVTSEQAQSNMQGLIEQSRAGGTFEKDSGWYRDAHDIIGQRAAAAGVDPDKFAGMVAATSPHCPWDYAHSSRLMNIELAEKAAVTAQANPGVPGKELATSLDSPGMLRNSLANAVDIYNGKPIEDVLRGPKVRSFYNNLTNPGGTNDVTVDTHQVRAIMNDRTMEVGMTPGNYKWAADQVRTLAATNGLSPDEAQAVTWAQWRRGG